MATKLGGWTAAALLAVSLALPAGAVTPKKLFKSPAVVKAKKPSTPKPGAKATARTAPRRVYVSQQVRAAAHDAVFQDITEGANIPVENTAAMIPFFELLYRHQAGELRGPVRILQYGDSHTAADEWTGELRNRFQERFGDGGSGYSFAGRINGIRRIDIRNGSSRGWHADGLVGSKVGDGIYGMGGLSLSTSFPRESVYLEADAASFELFYYQQPGGGALQLFDNGNPVERISTAGDAGPGYYRLDTTPGMHKFEVETLERAPVRLFGWVAENNSGVTYEPMGINGAQASIMLNWNEETLLSNVTHRDPSLIVLAYGTNEAGIGKWTVESYREMFAKLIANLRKAAPTATILVVGPPDRQLYTRKGWVTMDQLETIVEAQRQAAYAAGCPFWDTRAKMGGKDSMHQWVAGGMAQFDHVHLTTPGYHLLGDAIFRDVMSQYDLFLKARADVMAYGPRMVAGPHLPVSGN